jgi:predicted  nucleic acid-binding Zn ribbon protein
MIFFLLHRFASRFSSTVRYFGHLSARHVGKNITIEICPAGDKEGDAQGRQWEQRVEVMRDSMIYFRNNPSISVLGGRQQRLSPPPKCNKWWTLQKELDPNGGRVTGCRTA